MFKKKKKIIIIQIKIAYVLIKRGFCNFICRWFEKSAWGCLFSLPHICAFSL